MNVQCSSTIIPLALPTCLHHHPTSQRVPHLKKQQETKPALLRGCSSASFAHAQVSVPLSRLSRDPAFSSFPQPSSVQGDLLSKILQCPSATVFVAINHACVMPSLLCQQLLLRRSIDLSGISPCSNEMVNRACVCLESLYTHLPPPTTACPASYTEVLNASASHSHLKVMNLIAL